MKPISATTSSTLRLVEPVLHDTDHHTAQELATVAEQGSHGLVKERQIVDLRAAFGSNSMWNDRRVGPWGVGQKTVGPITRNDLGPALTPANQIDSAPVITCRRAAQMRSPSSFWIVTVIDTGIGSAINSSTRSAWPRYTADWRQLETPLGIGGQVLPHLFEHRRIHVVLAREGVHRQQRDVLELDQLSLAS